MSSIDRRSFVTAFFALRAAAQETKKTPSYPPQMEGAEPEVYKTINDVKLKLWIFRPQGHTSSDKRPAIVFFFGGGWRNGNPKQFEQHCRHLSSRGMVAITADYRVYSRQQAKVVDCIRDAKSAVRWVRTNSKRLGIDPDRIAAGGGSAGGHLAATTGVLDGLDESNEDLQISSRSNAMVLFNPVFMLAEAAGVDFKPRGVFDEILQRVGADPVAASPYHHIKKGAPPAIIFHGKADTTVPYVTAEAFAKKMAAAGSRCELVGYEGQPHGFFNYGRNDNEYFKRTLQRADEFLASLHYLN
jgi:acetyl esterase/lipase